MTSPDRLLHQVWGFAGFRPGQEEIVQAVIAGQNTLAIMPTGGGKSLCFQLPALCRDGVTVVISPLIALMRDQVRALKAAGVEAGALTSGNTEEETEEVSYTAKFKPECRTDAALLERTLNECMRLSRSDTLDAPTKIKGPITLTQQVFEALTEMKPRFLAKGFQLEDSPMRGRKPASLGTDVRLACISWKIVKVTTSRTKATNPKTSTSVGEHMLSEQSSTIVYIVYNIFFTHF